MLKPTGATCNLDCKYCFFLAKEKLYPNSHFRMEETLLEEYIRQYIASQSTPEVTFAWQGGEPTLMGLDFFRLAVRLQQKHCPPGRRVQNVLQTNGTRLDDNWGQFLRQHNFLVGISIDGPPKLHNAYRVDKRGGPTFDRVMKGLKTLKKYKVDFNILATVHAVNADHPLQVYHFFRDDLGAKFIQFIPVVERGHSTGLQEGQQVTERSVTGRQYGNFLNAIFDEWGRRDVGQVFVQPFDVALGMWLGYQPTLCVFLETCGDALVLEHNGDLYSCDHFVESQHKLGNIVEIPLVELVNSEQQRQFGLAKQNTLSQYCRECEVGSRCHGGCPKDRILETPDGEPGLNYLCEGYKSFFTHIDRPMRFMAAELRAGRPAANVMDYLAQTEKATLHRRWVETKRNDPCPCGSHRKYKHCHGRPKSESKP